ncbi:MAG: dihydrolipoamide acetyltransferase family protein [Desulfomonilaceae bacterium]
MKQIFKLPDVGEGIAEAEIVEYLVEVGEKIKADQMVVRVETDKAVVELPSPFSGTVAEIPHKPGDTVSVGDALLIIETEEVAAAEEEKKKPEREKKLQAAPAPEKRKPEPAHREEKREEPSPPEPGKEAEPGKVLATPHTRKLARELKVDITTVKGSGPQGRITDDDVRRAGEEAARPKEAPAAAPVKVPSTTGFDFEKYGPTRRVPLKGVRKRVAEVMARSAFTIPHVTHFDEADVTKLLEVAEKERALAESRGIKLTILSFLAKAAAASLKDFPVLNSSLDEETGEIVYKQYIHIGIATDTEAGLMVPVIRDVDRKSILQIASELQELAKKARERSIDLEDLRGGSFSITNVGAVGGTGATPIIQHPQAAILLSVRARKKPVVRDDQVVIRTIMPLALSFDHRILDGAEAARYMNHLIDLLEDPMRMLIDVA